MKHPSGRAKVKRAEARIDDAVAKGVEMRIKYEDTKQI